MKEEKQKAVEKEKMKMKNGNGEELPAEYVARANTASSTRVAVQLDAALSHSLSLATTTLTAFEQKLWPTSIVVFVSYLLPHKQPCQLLFHCIAQLIEAAFTRHHK